MLHYPCGWVSSPTTTGPDATYIADPTFQPLYYTHCQEATSSAQASVVDPFHATPTRLAPHCNMATSETYNPARAAKQIGIPGSTLRHWCAVYAEFLSPGANPGPGVERRLTDADVEILKAVVQLRANSLQPAEIVQRLRDNPAAPLQNLAETPTSRLEVQTVTHTQQNAIEAVLAVNAQQLSDVSRQIAGVDDRLRRVESTRWLVMAVVIAFAAGAVVVAVVVAVVAWLVATMAR